jgi:hypothetical protein
MSDIEILRFFRGQVGAPSPAIRAAARAELLGAMTSRGALRNRRPVLRGLAIAAAAAAATVSAVAIAGLLDGSPGVIERAAAAIDPQGRILHVVVRIEAVDGSVTRGESWVRPDGSGRSVDAESGPGGCLASETELRCLDAARNVVDVYRYHSAAVEAGRRYADLPGFRVDHPESIHRALASGYARPLGEKTLDGRPVHAIQLAIPFLDANGEATPRFDDATSPVLYLDRETYLPIAERFPDVGSTTYYERYEFLPNDARARRLLLLPTNADTRIVVHPVGEGPQG